MTMANTSKPYAEVIGDPIAHSKSPLIHTFWLEQLAIDAGYRACHVRQDALEAYFADRRRDPAWRGCNVTIPHKQAVQPFLGAVDTKAQAIGAVNTVFRGPDGTLTGTNTDVDGVADAVNIGVSGKGAAVVIGAGGAARAAFAQLATMGLSDVRVLARTVKKAQQAVSDCGLEARVIPFDQGRVALAGASLVINATQLGMDGQPSMPRDVLNGVSVLDAGALVFDMVYAPLETELLKAARAKGLRTSDGLTMLIGQAATAFAHFFGADPPRDRDETLRNTLILP